MRTTPPKVSAGLLRLALAHHRQSKVLGGVTKAMERGLQEISDVIEGTLPAHVTLKRLTATGGVVALWDRQSN